MKSDKSGINNLKKYADEISEKSIIHYEDLPEYDLFLSQVIDYLNNKFHDEKYTKNIIQNYIKSEVISKPESGKKRGYTKVHIIQLILLSHMRPILTSEEIKKVFSLAFNDPNSDEDDIISWEKAYEAFSKMQENVFENFVEFKDDEIQKIAQEFDINEKDEKRIMTFLIVLSLTAQASAIKKLVKKIVEKNLSL